MDYTLMCRSCLTTKSAEYIDMETPAAEGLLLLDYFNICTKLEATTSDNLPVIICTACSHDLQIAYEFIQSSKRADAILRQNLMDNAKQEEDEIREIYQSMEVEEEDIIIESKELAYDNEATTVEDDFVQYKHNEDPEQTCSALVSNITTDNEDLIKTEQTSDEEEEHANSEPKKLYQSEVIADVEPKSEDGDDDEYLVEYEEDNQNEAAESLLSVSMLAPLGSKWKCTICQKILRGDVSYEGHMNWHRGAKPYKCEHCFSKFRCKYSLERHTRNTHFVEIIRKTYPCEWCDKVFKLKSVMLCHQRTEHHEKQSQVCRTCGKIFFSEELLEQHIKVEHSPSNKNTTNNDKFEDSDEMPDMFFEDNGDECQDFQCEYCFRYFRSKQYLLDHKNSHTGEKPYKCQYCEKYFHSRASTSQHIRHHHRDIVHVKEIPIVTCEFCGKKLKQHNLKKHLLTHEKKPETESPLQYLCSFCPKDFKSKKQMENHENYIHKLSEQERKFQCDQCDSKFYLRRHLQSHRDQVHVDERRFVCPQCGNRFKRKIQLVAHVKLHGEKRIECPHCDKKYVRNVDLKIHMRTHTGELPYACHLCDKRYAIKVRLTYHLQKHLGVTHKCDECGASYNSRGKLKAHMFKHTGMPYVCEICPNQGFVARKYFRRHLQSVHRKEITDQELVEMFERNVGKAIRFKPVSEHSEEPSSSIDQFFEMDPTEAELETENNASMEDIQEELQTSVDGLLSIGMVEDQTQQEHIDEYATGES